MEELAKRIIDLSYEYRLSHINSSLNAVDIIDDIFSKKGEDDIFILSQGHAGLALYVILEKHCTFNADALLSRHGVHPHKGYGGIYCSTGSLGMGITVAVGVAMASPHKQIHCLISDGECAEGSVWEALRIIEDKKLYNLHIYVNANGQSALDYINLDKLEKRLKAFLPRIDFIRTKTPFFKILKGINAHYHILSKEDYNTLMEYDL